MGLGSLIRKAGEAGLALTNATSAMLHAESEATRLLAPTAAARTERAAQGLATTAFARPGSAEAQREALAIADATRGMKLIDLPGVAAGSRFRLAPGSKVAGLPVNGSALVESISDGHIALSVQGQLGPLSKRIGLELHRLDAGTGEFRVTGIGHGQPLLATIQDAGDAGLSFRAIGAPASDSLSVRAAGRGVDLTIPFGDSASTIHLVPA